MSRPKLTPFKTAREKEIKKWSNEVNRNLKRDHKTTNGRRKNFERSIDSEQNKGKEECGQMVKRHYCVQFVFDFRSQINMSRDSSQHLKEKTIAEGRAQSINLFICHVESYKVQFQ